jgi:hypothetical protein
MRVVVNAVWGVGAEVAITSVALGVAGRMVLVTMGDGWRVAAAVGVAVE